MVEGAQFKMGTLTLEGLPPELGERLRSLWQLPAGSPFDAFYPNRFVQEARSARGPELAAYGKTSIQTRFGLGLTVDVVILFSAGSRE